MDSSASVNKTNQTHCLCHAILEFGEPRNEQATQKLVPDTSRFFFRVLNVGISLANMMFFKSSKEKVFKQFNDSAKDGLKGFSSSLLRTTAIGGL